jgi:hypothetical protein
MAANDDEEEACGDEVSAGSSDRLRSRRCVNAKSSKGREDENEEGVEVITERRGRPGQSLTRTKIWLSLSQDES